MTHDTDKEKEVTILGSKMPSEREKMEGVEIMTPHPDQNFGKKPVKTLDPRRGEDEG